MKNVDYFAEAEEEIVNGVSQSKDQYGFRAEFDEAIRRLASGVVTGEPCGVRGYRRWILPRLPYSIIYRESVSEIMIVAFAHHKRKPGYWKRRLKP